MDDYDVIDLHDRLDGYRSPSQAEQVFGHGQQAAFLASQYASGKMHHAFLFEGPSGIGKASLAFVFARHLIENPDYLRAPALLDGAQSRHLIRPMAMGAHPQVLHLTRPIDPKTGKHKTQLTIEETRRIGHFLSHTVAGNGNRVVIIDPVNDMNSNAANALLKNLEEPTPRTVFILIAQSSGKLLATIRSRCLLLRFQALSESAMQHALDSMGLKQRLSDDALQELILRAGGSPRNAAMLCDGGGLDIIKTAESVLSAGRFDPALAMKLGEVVSSRESEPVFQLLCDHLISFLAQRALFLANAEQLHDANKVSQVLSDIGSKMRATSTYNLDRKQTILDLLWQIHAIEHAG